jgi:hypothetical protein
VSLMNRSTVDVNEDDLRTLAERGYEGAASTDHDQQAQRGSLEDTLLKPDKATLVLEREEDGKF